MYMIYEGHYSSCVDIWEDGDKPSLIDTSGIYRVTLSDGSTTDQRCIFTYFPSLDQYFVGAMFQSFNLSNGKWSASAEDHKFQCGFGDTSNKCMESQDSPNYNSFKWSTERIIGYRNDTMDPYSNFNVQYNIENQQSIYESVDPIVTQSKLD